MIAYTVFDTKVEALQQRLKETAIWNEIPAVKKGNVLFYLINDTLNDYDYASRIVSLDSYGLSSSSYVNLQQDSA